MQMAAPLEVWRETGESSDSQWDARACSRAMLCRCCCRPGGTRTPRTLFLWPRACLPSSACRPPRDEPKEWPNLLATVCRGAGSLRHRQSDLARRSNFAITGLAPACPAVFLSALRCALGDDATAVPLSRLSRFHQGGRTRFPPSWNCGLAYFLRAFLSRSTKSVAGGHAFPERHPDRQYDQSLVADGGCNRLAHGIRLGAARIAWTAGGLRRVVNNGRCHRQLDRCDRSVLLEVGWRSFGACAPESGRHSPLPRKT